MQKKIGFIEHNNINVLEAKEDCCKIKVELSDISLNPYGIAHGGLIFSLGDTAMGVMCLTKNRKAITINANIDFLKPGTGKFLIADASIIKMGKNTCVLRSNIKNDKDELISTMSSTYFFIE